MFARDSRNILDATFDLLQMILDEWISLVACAIHGLRGYGHLKKSFYQSLIQSWFMVFGQLRHGENFPQP